MGKVIAEVVAVAVVRMRPQGVQNLDSHGLDFAVALDQLVWSIVLAVALYCGMAGGKVPCKNIQYACIHVLVNKFLHIVTYQLSIQTGRMPAHETPCRHLRARTDAR